MPISRAEFEKGRRIESLEQAIIDFLNSNRERVYTSNEIYAELFHPPVFDPYDPKIAAEIGRIERILDTLIGKNAILARGIGVPNEIYYTVP